MNRKLTLLLPLALLAACSQTPAPAGNGGDDVAPAAAKAADQQTLAQLDAQRLQSQHWLLQQATGADGGPLGLALPYQLYLMLPYLMAIVVLVLVARRAAYPQALMKPYRKGER